MTLEEILQIEAQNVDCNFSVSWEERSMGMLMNILPFYCYSLLGILDIDWLPCPDGGFFPGSKTIRVRVSEPDKIFVYSLCYV